MGKIAFGIGKSRMWSSSDEGKAGASTHRLPDFTVDATDYPPVVHPRNATHLVRQHRTKPLELFLAQPNSLKSTLPLTRSLNHILDAL